jgi:hypothetical protein
VGPPEIVDLRLLRFLAILLQHLRQRPRALDVLERPLGVLQVQVAILRPARHARPLVDARVEPEAVGVFEDVLLVCAQVAFLFRRLFVLFLPVFLLRELLFAGLAVRHLERAGNDLL